MGIEEIHLSAQFWIDRLPEPDEVLMDREAIRAFNANAYATDPHLVDIGGIPARLPGDEVHRGIRAISKPYKAPLFYHDGREVAESDYRRYTDNLALDSIPDSVEVRFGLVLRRADMRTWPTEDAVYKSTDTIDLDRFQENGLFPAAFVAVLHESRDGEWYFAQSYNYAAWVRRDRIAIGDREEIKAYKNAEPFVVVTGDRIETTFNPVMPAISELQLDMGVRLPLADPQNTTHDVHGQNPYTSYVVRLPVADGEGGLAFESALIARRHDVRRDYLPYTPANVIRQGFKFLGERYGWGHSYNARDCTGLVSEVYKAFGIIMPRNSAQQGNSPIGRNVQVPGSDTRERRLRKIGAMEVGDLLYFPGHVMMYIGDDDGKPYVLHDTSSGLRYVDEDGEYYEGILNGVSVTPLISLQTSEESSYVDELYAIKRIR
jgi:cell wall-associated NlpC family hydrolase